MLPVLLWDVMDTLVRDPFRDAVPRFFGLDLQALVAAKHPTAWVDFERGVIDEAGYGARAFLDGRPVDVGGLKAAMAAAYAWLPGMEALLAELRDAGHEMHALSNYPPWFALIEARLGLSRYLAWSFVSCRTGVRKPAPEAYLGAARALGRSPAECLFVDDRGGNVRAAEAVGMPALRFEDVASLRASLAARGLRVRVL